ncbi:hypothetical protein BU16DRAFT_428704, partial [Lophium mytilinum]
ELKPILECFGLEAYHDVLISNGFEQWETVLEITEEDLNALEFKRGHRRLLQLEIAHYREHPI